MPDADDDPAILLAADPPFCNRCNRTERYYIHPGDAWIRMDESTITATTSATLFNVTGGTYVVDTYATTGGVLTYASNAPFYRARRQEIAANAERARSVFHAAADRARVLLEAHLAAPQLAELRAHGYFHVMARSGRRYRIRDGTLVANVDLIEGERRVVRRYCAHPAGVPIADALLAQKLMIETDEEAFLRVANVHPAPWDPDNGPTPNFHAQGASLRAPPRDVALGWVPPA